MLNIVEDPYATVALEFDASTKTLFGVGTCSNSTTRAHARCLVQLDPSAQFPKVLQRHGELLVDGEPYYLIVGGASAFDIKARLLYLLIQPGAAGAAPALFDCVGGEDGRCTRTGESVDAAQSFRVLDVNVDTGATHTRELKWGSSLTPTLLAGVAGGIPYAAAAAE